MFGVKDIQVNESPSKYLSRGINNRVTIGNIEGVSPEGANPYINITLHKESATIEDGKTFKLSFAETAKKYSVMKLTHIATKVITLDDMVAIDESSTSIEDFATRLNAVLRGQTINWFKLSVEQYMNANNEVKERLVIGLPPFADNSIQTKLKFSETNPYDYKAVKAPAVTAQSDDLPF